MKLEVQYLRVDYKDGYVSIDEDGEIDDEDTSGMSLAEEAYLHQEALKIAKEVGLKPSTPKEDNKVTIGRITLHDGNDNSISLSEDEDDEDLVIDNLNAKELLDFSSEAMKFKEKFFPSKKKTPTKKK